MNSNYSLKIDKNILKENIDNLKTSLKDYDNIILNLSNNALNHGLVIANDYVKWGINNFLIDNLEEAINLRNYNREITIWCSEKINPDYIYDAINSNINIRIYSYDDLEKINDLKIRDDINLELLISSSKIFPGISSTEEFLKCLEIINNNKYMNLKGITTDLMDTSIYTDDFLKQYSLFLKYTKLVNNIKVTLSEKCLYYKKRNSVNSVVINTLHYGIINKNNAGLINKLKDKNLIKKNHLQNKLKELDIILKPSFFIQTNLIKIFGVEKKEICLDLKFKTSVNIGVIPVGKNIGLDNLESVSINNTEYLILKIENNYSYILLDEFKDSVKEVFITENNLNLKGTELIQFMKKMGNNLKIKYQE